MFKNKTAAKNFVLFDKLVAQSKGEICYLPFDSVNKCVVDKYEDMLSEEDAEATFSTITESIEAIANLKSNFSKLVEYYTESQKQYDLATQDILHRIELGPINGITALRLVKQLKEIRKKRRICKDRIDFLGRITDNPDIFSTNEILNRWNNEKNKRSYRPRVLDNLF